jgi:hypothetical protein
MALGSCAIPFYCMMVSYCGLICLNLQKSVRFSSICFVIFLSECCSHWFFFSSSKVGETSNEFSCMELNGRLEKITSQLLILLKIRS